MKRGLTPKGDEKRPIIMNVVALHLLTPGKEVDVFVDDVAIVDTAVYVPEADVEGLPFRVAWATRTEKAPVIDGKLADADGWRAAPTT